MPYTNSEVYNTFQHIDSVEPIVESDIDCFKEIREILIKYDKLERFGVTLLHKHFDLKDDEVLIESTDENTRAQIIIPLKQTSIADLGNEILETAWALQEGNAVMSCLARCVYGSDGYHKLEHIKGKT